MKKSLLMMTGLLLTILMVTKAQAPVTWNANTYCVDSSIAADAVALTAQQEVVVGDITFTALEKAGAGWLYKVTADPVEFTYNSVTYSASYIQGQTNPLNGRILRDGDYPAIAKFTSTTSGSLDVTFKFGYNKRFWVAAIPKTALEDLDLNDSLAISAYAYQYSEGATYWSGYFDPTTTPPSYFMGATPTVDPGGTYFTGITLNVDPDHEYFVYFAGSKLMLCGFTYTATPVVTEYSVSGTVKTGDGTAVEGVLITSSDSKTATTNASGEYSITGITEASVTLTPSKTDYTFAPGTITLTMDKDYTGQDFVATPVVMEYSVSGTVQTSTSTPVEGVLITSSDSKTATTNASGEYSITGITDASITLTPSKTDYTFAPVSLTLTMDKDYTAQNFVATFSTGILDGKVSNITVVSTEYYNFLGKKLEKPVLGDLNIIVRTYSDGTVKAQKVLIQE
jgi:hypothetical protein